MSKKKNLFERFSEWATAATGSSAAFIIAVAVASVPLIRLCSFQRERNWDGKRVQVA